jgi:hypothetical protein
LADLAKDDKINFIVGDWMSEYNMTTRGGSKVDNCAERSEYEYSFLEALEPALPSLQSNGIKVVVNAGASDTEKLHDVVTSMVKDAGLSLKVAWIGGDEAFDAIQKATKLGSVFKSLTTGEYHTYIGDSASAHTIQVLSRLDLGKPLSTWEFEPIYAQAYLGGWGIVEALRNDADIVLCGRVADASPTIGCAAYHFGWSRQDYGKLAHAFAAGHFIECSTYVTGGNFTGFKSLPGKSLDLGFPIVEMKENGEFFVTKQAGRDGIVTSETCKAQLLYEIQGPRYYNSDVVAILDNIKIEDVGENRVLATLPPPHICTGHCLTEIYARFISNVGSDKPPPTTKVGITAKGGFQAEAHYFLCGLDIEEKAKMLERQVRHVLDESKFHCLKFRINGRCPVDPRNQDAATVDLRIFAQAKLQEELEVNKFFRPVTDTIMQSYPGATFAVDARQSSPKPYYEYWVSILPQGEVQHVCHVPFKGLDVPIPAPDDTEPFIHEQDTYEPTSPIDLNSLGPTTRAPLGYIVHARSGDKGSDANAGFFVRNACEWDWLRTFLTTNKVRELLGEDDTGKPIFRFELPNIWGACASPPPEYVSI